MFPPGSCGDSFEGGEGMPKYGKELAEGGCPHPDRVLTVTAEVHSFTVPKRVV